MSISAGHTSDIVKLYSLFEKHGFYEPLSDKSPIWVRIFASKCDMILCNAGTKIKVLDVGTGMSVALMTFTRQFPNTVKQSPILSIDTNRRATELARRKLKEKAISDNLYQLIVADACSLCFGDGTFDLIVCVLSIHDISEQGFALYEMLNSCRQNGFVLIIDSSEDFRNQIYKHPDEAIKKGVVKFVNPADLEAMLRQILPRESIAIERFREGGNLVVKTTPYFACVIKKTEKAIRKIEDLDQLATKGVQRLTKEFNTRVQLSQSVVWINEDGCCS